VVKLLPNQNLMFTLQHTLMDTRSKSVRENNLDLTVKKDVQEPTVNFFIQKLSLYL
jgi:hypothetical protein